MPKSLGHPKLYLKRILEMTQKRQVQAPPDKFSGTSTVQAGGQPCLCEKASGPSQEVPLPLPHSPLPHVPSIGAASCCLISSATPTPRLHAVDLFWTAQWAPRLLACPQFSLRCWRRCHVQQACFSALGHRDNLAPFSGSDPPSTLVGPEQ